MANAKRIFKCLSGNNGLTEEFIYYAQAKCENISYKVLSGATTEDKMLGYVPQSTILEYNLKCFEDKNGILVTRKGKAGKMFFLPKGKYTINDDAYILSLREDFKKDFDCDDAKKEIIYLKYFIYYHQYDMYEYATNSDNGTWNKTAFFKYCDIKFPEFNIMEQLVNRYERCKQLQSDLMKLNKEIKILEKKTISLDNIEGKQGKLEEILSYKSRNDSLSKEGIYKFQPDNDKNIIVLSGSTDNIQYGKIGIDTPKIHYLENRQCLHVVTRGKSGKLTFVEKGNYATNTNAFLLYIEKDKWKELNIRNEQEEKVYLKYLLLYLQPLFYEQCSRADVSVFPLSQIIKKLDIVKLKYNQNMIRIVNLFDLERKLRKTVENILEEINELEEKAILCL